MSKLSEIRPQVSKDVAALYDFDKRFLHEIDGVLQELGVVKRPLHENLLASPEQAKEKRLSQTDYLQAAREILQEQEATLFAMTLERGLTASESKSRRESFIAASLMLRLCQRLLESKESLITDLSILRRDHLRAYQQLLQREFLNELVLMGIIKIDHLSYLSNLVEEGPFVQALDVFTHRLENTDILYLLCANSLRAQHIITAQPEQLEVLVGVMNDDAVRPFMKDARHLSVPVLQLIQRGFDAQHISLLLSRYHDFPVLRTIVDESQDHPRKLQETTIVNWHNDMLHCVSYLANHSVGFRRQMNDESLNLNEHHMPQTLVAAYQQQLTAEERQHGVDQFLLQLSEQVNRQAWNKSGRFLFFRFTPKGIRALRRVFRENIEPGAEGNAQRLQQINDIIHNRLELQPRFNRRQYDTEMLYRHTRVQLSYL